MRASSLRTLLIQSCLLLMVLITAASAIAADIPAPPINPLEGSVISVGTYYRYDAMTIKGADTKEILGNYWLLYLDLPQDKDAVLRHYHALIQDSGGRILHKDGPHGYHFLIPNPEGNIYGIIRCTNQVKHTLKIVQEAACPGIVQFGDGNFILADTSPTPTHSIFTDMHGTELRKGDFNDFNKLTREYRQHGKSVKKEVSGKYWHRYVSIIDTPERPAAHVSAREIRDSFLNAAIKAKAEILPRNDRGVSLRIDNPEGGVSWAYIWPQDGKYSMKIIDEAPMDQVLVFDSNEMMAQLDALGKITLEGIFFDTARSTLKQESDASLGAALELLTDFPDLVVEVAGHTDDVGKADANQKLSEGRATSVRQWLLDHGIDGPRLIAKGYGEGSPIADNSTDVGRAKNRRVELVKISGGQVRDVISLIQPYPGSVLEVEKDPVTGGTMTINMLQDNGKRKEQIITGTLVRKYFLVLDDAGVRDKNISGLQILRNYAVAAKKFGGEILAEQTHGLWFKLENLDGSSTYVHVHAPGPKYNIETINQQK